MNVEQFFAIGGPLSEKFEGYQPRSQQVELSKMIEQSIAEGIPLLGEAPTGVGKSLAALVPAFQRIKETDAPVLVVTSSILLQEQYFYKDVPMLEKLMDMKVNPVLLKGRSNYLCKTKLVDNQIKVSSSDQSKEAQEILEWAAGTESGDITDLDFSPSYPVWSEFAAMDPNECNGKDCPFYNSCFYYANRDKMHSSKLIICNYHYFFTALKMENMLPAGIQIVILDEGHEIPDIARSMEEVKYDEYSFKKLNRMLATAQKKAAHTLGDIPIADIIELIPLLESHQKLLIDATKLYLENKEEGKDNWVIGGSGKEELHRIGGQHLEDFKNTIDALGEFVINRYPCIEYGGYDELDDDEYEWVSALQKYQQGLIERYKLAKRFLSNEDLDLGYEVLNWIEPTNSEFITFRSKPFDAKPITGPIFTGEAMPGVVPIVLSATLSVNGSLRHLSSSLGIEGFVNEITVSSPFDLKENLLWYLPKDFPAGNEQGHSVAVLKEMERVIRVLNGRTLCLFTSSQQMKNASNHLKRILPESIQVVTQGEQPKKKIIDLMQKNDNVVIIGTRSFFTGVDIQGSNLSAVLIDKLPFPMIGDPINDYLMSLERGFWRYTLPETVIAIKQGFGRLNRTVNDKGVVAVFDGRLSSAGYKGRIFNSFDFEISATRDFEQVKIYLEGILHGDAD